MSRTSPTYIDKNDFDRLREIAENLSNKYPNDWLGKFWHGANTHIFLGAIVLGILLANTSLPIWLAFIPYLVASLMFRHLPALLLKRKMHAPRWAHPNALLSSKEVHEIEAVVQRLKPVQRAVVSKFLPVNSGDKFWIIWSSAQEYAAGNAHISEELKIGWKDWVIQLSSLVMSTVALFLMLQMILMIFGFDFPQWLLSQIENSYVRSVIQYLTLPMLKK